MRKILSLLILIAWICGSIPANGAAAEADSKVEVGENQAYAVLYENPELTNFSKVEMGEENVVRLLERDGQRVWSLDVDNGTKSYQMNFDLADAFAHEVSDGSVFEIEVEYYNDSQGYMQLAVIVIFHFYFKYRAI